MSPRRPDPNLKRRLVQTAARLLAEEGPAAFTTRRLARETGASTTAIYTHFDGMAQLRRAVRGEGFGRLTTQLEQVPRTEDPVADLAAIGLAYCHAAWTAPHLYRTIFLEAPLDEDDAADSVRPLSVTAEAVDRCIRAKRFTSTEAWPAAIQMWIATHGVVSALLSQLMPLGVGIEQLRALGLTLFTGFGDDRILAEHSLDAGLKFQEADWADAATPTREYGVRAAQALDGLEARAPRRPAK